MRVEESLNVIFDETPPPPRTSPLEDDDLFEEEAIEVNKTRPLGNDVEDKSFKSNEIINIKESKSHPLENVTARLESIRILLAYACALNFKLFQMDVKSAFLNCFINEEVYVAQPLGFIDFAKPNHVYRLKKALYGLKQAPKAWPKSKNAKVRVNTEESAVKPEPELKNTIGCNLNPSDGPGKPNSIIMKTVKTKWALNQLQQPICVHLTKTVKTLKAQS
ncbi:retrovirus-related pol polyprotein from transposon TNT 1-94 [Tanacetum coccineum]